ncbi:NB-ARC domain-containing protein [Nostoc sp. 106C]|uniref:NB-ARC domain-containing protein n=1 Tax=Nostoc sp. 106C TaxID=1932667 RepID=UPI000A38CBFD|nr:NB-ARC domain-containing protein [Nostoc sp. 106C]OUL34835.1 hypothetical protein BV375_03390 [Nostoc sp. 106C]
MGISLRASTQGLDIVEQARIRKGWKKQDDTWCGSVPTSRETLKRFRRGEPIQKETFMRICEVMGVDWQRVVDNTVHPRLSPPDHTKDWGEAPDVWVFYGRTQELAKLQRVIVQDRCRVVSLLGIGGIGKTALAVQLAEQIQDEFEYFIWRSLRNAPSLESLLVDLVSFFSHQQQTQAELSQLIDFLCQHRCLMVLDELDAIFGNSYSAGYYRPGYEAYGELIKQVGERRNLQSCLVLTSREKPQEIVSLESNRLAIRSLLLEGLGDAASAIFKEEELLYEPEQWQELIQMYRGNPLALKIVSTTIQDLFGGSVAEFLRHNTIVVSDQFREILDHQFQRLSLLEKKIMYMLANYKYPISLEQLKQNVSLIISTSEIIEALDSLSRRSLIEKSTEQSAVLFTLQPVVMKYVKRFKE